MRTVLRKLSESAVGVQFVLVILIALQPVLAVPTLRPTDPVANAASYSREIAPGSIFVVIGAELSGQGTVVATSFPLRPSMNGTSVQFRAVAGGPVIDALMVYTTRNQIAAILPSSAAPGDYNVSVRYNNQTSPAAQVVVIPRNLGIFTANSAGFGPAQALNRGALELNRFARGRLGPYTTGPASPGMRVDLYGTGLGQDLLSDSTGGSSGHQDAAAVRVVVGGRETRAVYAGRSEGTAGLDQIVFFLPDDTPLGCAVDAQVLFANGQRSNTFGLSIASPGDSACQHRYLSGDVLRAVSQGQTVALGVFHLSRQIVYDACARSAAGHMTISPTSWVVRFEPTRWATWLTFLLFPRRPGSASPSVGRRAPRNSCSVPIPRGDWTLARLSFSTAPGIRTCACLAMKIAATFARWQQGFYHPEIRR